MAFVSPISFFPKVTEFVSEHSLGMPQFDPDATPPFFSLTPNIIGPPAKWSKQAAGMGAIDIAYGAGLYILGYVTRSIK